jgi:hypothetical protein
MKPVPDIPKEILDASFKGRLVVFIGAGVSRIVGCPSWKEFALLHLKYLFEKNAFNYYEFAKLKEIEPRKLLSICKKIYEDKNLSPKKTADLLQGNIDLINKYPIYDELYAFNAIYLTTNYDIYLDEAAQKAGRIVSKSERSSETSVPIEEKTKYEIINSQDDLLVTCLKNGNIIHLHGSIQNEQQMIITITDYMALYEKDSKPAVLLEEVFRSFTVLFVGYGLEEYEILEFMINRSLIARGAIQHYMLYPVFKAESNLLDFQQKYYSDLGVQLIPYPIDENGYEQLATVVHEWTRQIGPTARPQKYYEKIRLIDEVL